MVRDSHISPTLPSSKLRRLLATTAVRLEKESHGLTGEDLEWLHQFVLRLMIKADDEPAGQSHPATQS